MQLAGEVAGLGEQRAEESGVFRKRVGVRGDVALGDEQDVGGGLWMDVGEGEDVGGFVEAFGGDDAGDDLAKKAIRGGRVGHEGIVSRGPGVRFAQRRGREIGKLSIRCGLFASMYV